MSRGYPEQRHTHTMNTQETIRSKLAAAFTPVHLEVVNESHRHNVPKQAETHFRVVIVSTQYQGKTLLARHRLVNQVLAEELQDGVHALSLHTKTPDEWEHRASVGTSPPCLGGEPGRPDTA